MSHDDEQHPEDFPASDARFENILRVILAAAICLLLIGTSLLGVAYIAASFTRLADYGDSPYYLAGAYRWEGFHANRGVFYPPLAYFWLRTLAFPLSSLGALQFLCLLTALAVFVRHLAQWARCAAPVRPSACIAFAAAGLASSPLLLHHALSVMPDALATALMLLVTVAIVDGMPAGEELRWNRKLLWLALAGLACSLIRNEHAYIVAVFAISTGTLYAVLATSSRMRRHVALHCLGFLACVAASMGINGAIQRASPMPDAASLPQMLAVSRISWGALPSIEQQLQQKTRRLLGDVDELNEHPHNLPKRYEELLESAPRSDVEDTLQDVLSTSLEYDWHNFTTRYYRDWIQHLVLDISYPMCVPDGRSENCPGHWTYSRTVAHADSPELVNSWIAASQALFWALLAGALLGSRTRTWALTPRMLLGSIVIVFFCAAFYATVTPNFNPRYGLPAAAVGHMTLLTLGVSALARRKVSNEISA